MKTRSAKARSAQDRGVLLQWAVVVGALITLVAVIQAHVAAGTESPEARLTRHFDAQVLEGPAPDIEVVRQDGSKVKLSELRGKVVFVNFWATWCPPCRAEIPDLEKLSQLMRHVPFEILAVSSDQSWDDIRKFFGGRESRMLIGLDPGGQATAARYGTEKLPETYVVDRDGNLRLRFVNIQPWTDERIHRYLEWLATSG